MRTLRIFGLGIIALSLVSGLILVQHWKETKHAEEGLSILRELTPEKVIASCGQPASDEVSYMPAIENPKPLSRVIMYKGPQAAGWAKLTFEPVLYIQDESPIAWHLVSWRLTFFASAAVGTPPQAEGAYLAVSELPCLRNRENLYLRMAKDKLSHLF